LKLFGEAGTVKISTSTSPKLADRGAQCMMVGYAESHDGDVYRKWNPITRRVHITRDIIWMKAMLFQKKVDEVDGALPPEVETVLIEMDSMNESDEIENDHEAEEGGTTIIYTEVEDDEDEPLEEGTREDQWVTATTRAGRISRLPARYRQELNVAALNSLAGRNYYELLIEEDDDDANELACVGAGLRGGFENTNELNAMNYKTAIKTPDKKKWKKAVEEEHDRMV